MSPSIVETSSQEITSLRIKVASKTSLRLEWSLSERNTYDSQGLFSVFVNSGDSEKLAGTTKNHFYLIHGLEHNKFYTVRVELHYPFSPLISKAITHQHLAVH